MVDGLNRDQIRDSAIVEEKELESLGVLDSNAKISGPITIVSVVSSTKTITLAPGTELYFERLDAGDQVVVVGGSAAGTYTIDEIIDDETFKVVESISDATSGTVDFYHPIGAKKVGFKDSRLSSTNVNDAVVESSTKVAVSDNDTIPDHLENKIQEGAGITITKQNAGGNEFLEVSSDEGNALCGFILTEDLGFVFENNLEFVKHDGSSCPV